MDSIPQVGLVQSRSKSKEVHSLCCVPAKFPPHSKLSNVRSVTTNDVECRSKTPNVRTKICELFTILSHDGNNIISCSDDKTIRIWDLKTGNELKTLTGHTASINGVILSHDGNNIISCSDDKTIRIWDLKTGNELKTLTGHTASINSVILSHDGNNIISCSDDKTIRIWDLKTGNELKTLTGHTYNINSVILSHDGNNIISWSLDNTIRIWDLKTGKLLSVVTCDFVISSLILIQNHIELLLEMHLEEYLPLKYVVQKLISKGKTSTKRKLY